MKADITQSNSKQTNLVVELKKLLVVEFNKDVFLNLQTKRETRNNEYNPKK